jgi:hypothetical protein
VAPRLWAPCRWASTGTLRRRPTPPRARPVLLNARHHRDTTVPAAPDDPERPRRLAWAALLKRAFRIDVLACPKCGGRMGLVAVILDPVVAEQIVRHLGLGTRAPPAVRRVAPVPGPDLPFVE